MLQIQNLKGYIPDVIIDQLPEVCAKFDIDGPKRLSHLIGQCKHESGNFSIFTENLNYSEQGLLKTFPKYFTQETAVVFAKKPEKIANHVYADRMGNGPETLGNGYRYRGRGAIQLTGRDNYKAFGAALGVDLLANPDLVSTTYPIASAAFFFKSNGLWTICDKGTDVPTITAVTKRVNGGIHGLSERILYTQEVYRLLQGSF